MQFSPIRLLARFLLPLALVAALVGAAGAQAPRTPAVGDKAPDITLKDFKGKKFSLSELKGREGVILWFTNLCTGCQTKFAAMERLESRYGGKGVEIIAVSQLGKDRKTVERMVRQHKLTFRFLYDPDGEATTRFSGGYTPGTCPLTSLYLIDRDGMIVFASHYPGAPDEDIAAFAEKMGTAARK